MRTTKVWVDKASVGYSPTALPRHAYVCRRHYSGALTQGSLYRYVHTYSVAFAKVRSVQGVGSCYAKVTYMKSVCGNVEL